MLSPKLIIPKVLYILLKSVANVPVHHDEPQISHKCNCLYGGFLNVRKPDGMQTTRGRLLFYRIMVIFLKLETTNQ